MSIRDFQKHLQLPTFECWDVLFDVSKIFLLPSSHVFYQVAQIVFRR